MWNLCWNILFDYIYCAIIIWSSFIPYKSYFIAIRLNTSKTYKYNVEKFITEFTTKYF